MMVEAKLSLAKRQLSAGQEVFCDLDQVLDHVYGGEGGPLPDSFGTRPSALTPEPISTQQTARIGTLSLFLLFRSERGHWAALHDLAAQRGPRPLSPSRPEVVDDQEVQPR